MLTSITTPDERKILKKGNEVGALICAEPKATKGIFYGGKNNVGRAANIYAG